MLRARKVVPTSIHACARALHTGRMTWLWDIEFHDDAARLCATSRLSIAIKTYSHEPAPSATASE